MLQHFARAVGFERDDQLAGIGHRMDFALGRAAMAAPSACRRARAGRA